MMEIFKFIHWWWGKYDNLTQMGLLSIPVVIVFFGSMYLFGAVTILYALAVAVGGATFIACGQLKKSICNRWAQYQNEKEIEAQQIVDRLAGSSYTNRSADLLNRIRKKI